jgi:Protein of unknown function (DUF2726)
MLHFLAPLLIAIVLLAAISAFFRHRSNLSSAKTSQSQSGVSYEAQPALLSPAERSFFGVLQQAAPADYLIFAKVRLADIVRPAQSPSRSGWQSAFNRITGKHVDFVLCDSLHLEVLAVIELDDKTHQRFDRGTRDGLVDAALTDARIPVLRIPARQAYSPAQVRELIVALVTGTKAAEPPARPSWGF